MERYMYAVFRGLVHILCDGGVTYMGILLYLSVTPCTGKYMYM